MRAAALLLLLTAPAFAQTTAHPEDLATVTGHITCADTQRPARLASVRLVPVDTAGGPKDSKSKDDFNAFGNSLPAVQTDLSGAYTIHNVRPGRYYLRVDLTGYVTPLFSFRPAELSKPTPEIQQRIEHELQLLTVAPHSTLIADASLRRSGSIAGTVTFDDGTPAIGVMVRILRRDAKGEFKENVVTAGMSWAQAADDRGHFRLTSLPAGEYVVEADLNLSTQDVSRMPMPNGTMVDMVMTRFLFQLPVYSGSVIRRKDATPIKLDAGQDATDADITIPISQLHDVSGTLLAKDGHTINGGKVQLLFADDHAQFAEVDVNNDDATFHFPYVPEGNYILSVKEAKDVGRVEVPNPAGVTPRTHIEHPTLRTYGTTEQPLAVQSDLQSLTISVPDQTSTTAAATSLQ